MQYSVINDTTRIKLARIYSERLNHYSVEFLDYIRNKSPFRIKRISTDDEMFNNHRPHMGLKGLTSLQKLQSYAKYRSITYVYG